MSLFPWWVNDTIANLKVAKLQLDDILTAAITEYMAASIPSPFSTSHVAL